jgi:hypothetical protein
MMRIALAPRSPRSRGDGADVAHRDGDRLVLPDEVRVEVVERSLFSCSTASRFACE